MGFGNPYGEEMECRNCHQMGETAGRNGNTNNSFVGYCRVSNPQNIKTLFQALIPEIPQVEFGAHLHSHR